MKDDMVSRAAIDEWKNDFKGYINALDIPKDDYKGIMEYIDELPSAQQWIPVTERLPKKDGDYLVTTHSGQIARYIFIGGSSEEYWRRCATAWMPLPNPWEGDVNG